MFCCLLFIKSDLLHVFSQLITSKLNLNAKKLLGLSIHGASTVNMSSNILYENKHPKLFRFIFNYAWLNAFYCSAHGVLKTVFITHTL